MANLTSSRAASRSRMQGPTGAGVVYCEFVTLSVAAADLTLAATHAMFPLPSGAKILGAGMLATDLDTNGTPLITLQLGDAGDVDRLIAASTIAQTGTATQTLAATGIGYTYTADTMINVTVSAAAATGAAGTITAYVMFTL